MASIKSPINVSDDEHSEPDSTSIQTSPSSLLRSVYSLANISVTLTSDTKRKVQIKKKYIYLYLSSLKKKATPFLGLSA